MPTVVEFPGSSLALLSRSLSLLCDNPSLLSPPLPPPPPPPPFRYTFKVQINGADVEGNTGAADTVAITVAPGNPNAARSIMSPSSLSGVAGQEVEFSIQLKDSYGNTVSDVISDFSVIKPKATFAEGDAAYLTQCCNGGGTCSRCLGQQACGSTCVAWGTCGTSTAATL